MIQHDRVHSAPQIGAPPRRRPSATRVVMLVMLAAAVAWSAWAIRARQRDAASAAAAAASASMNRVIPVLTAEVAQRDVPLWLEGLGNVAAYYTVTVRTQVDGRIDRVVFQEGQHVRKGEVLVQIDPRPFAIQLESAQAALARDAANLKNARVNLERYRTLTQQNLIAVQQLTDQQANVDQLDAQTRSDQAAIDAARLNLDYARIASPIDGVVGVRLVDPGNVVHAADASGLVVVTQLDPIAVFFTLPEDDLPSVQKATAASGPLAVEAWSRDGTQLIGQGTLLVIDNQINQGTATARLKAIFPNADQHLWPNQFVKARLRLGTRPQAIVVPTAAVQHGPQGTFAYVVAADSTAVVRPVTVAMTQGDVSIVTTGLSPGETVVVEGQAQLRPSARVAPKAAPSASASAGDGAFAAPAATRSTPGEPRP